MISVPNFFTLALLTLGFSLESIAGVKIEESSTHIGICDASAGVAVSETAFVVANDEKNHLHVYAAHEDGKPIKTFGKEALKDFLAIDKWGHEVDTEGAARVGDRIYWITSHGRNKSAKFKPERHRLFATRITVNSGQFELDIIGKPYHRLLKDVLSYLQSHHTDVHATLNDAEPKAPKEGGINIEGLAARSDGSLIIGLRSPVKDRKAILIGIKNPDQVVDSGAEPIFTDPVLLDLGGRGIRSIEYWPWKDSFLLVAGPIDNESSFQLWRWSGVASATPKLLTEWTYEYQSAEALFVYPSSNKVQILMDEGSRPVDSNKCKDALEPHQSFTSFWVTGL